MVRDKLANFTSRRYQRNSLNLVIFEFCRFTFPSGILNFLNGEFHEFERLGISRSRNITRDRFELVNETLNKYYSFIPNTFTRTTISTIPVTTGSKQTQLAYQMAEEMSQFKAGFLARTTHELRSPLNGLIGLHQLILSDLCENPAEEREFIAQAHERALKLHKLFDEILNIARIEHGTNKLDIQPLSLINILQEVEKLTYMLAANRNLRLQILLPSPEIYVLADPHWLRQVLINLINNTILHMEEGSIYLSSQIVLTNDSVHIWLDAPTNSISWSEPTNLITKVNSSETKISLCLQE